MRQVPTGHEVPDDGAELADVAGASVPSTLVTGASVTGDPSVAPGTVVVVEEVAVELASPSSPPHDATSVSAAVTATIR